MVISKLCYFILCISLSRFSMLETKTTEKQKAIEYLKLCLTWKSIAFKMLRLKSKKRDWFSSRRNYDLILNYDLICKIIHIFLLQNNFSIKFEYKSSWTEFLYIRDNIDCEKHFQSLNKFPFLDQFNILNLICQFYIIKNLFWKA